MGQCPSDGPAPSSDSVSSQAPTSRRYRASAKLTRLDRLRCSRLACRSAARFNSVGKLIPVVVRIVLMLSYTVATTLYTNGWLLSIVVIY
jgi:hypothetical protein